MANIVLISVFKKHKKLTKDIVDRILQCINNKIIVLVVNAPEDKMLYLDNPQIKHVYSFLDLECMESTRYLDYNIIKKFKNAQLLVENYLFRRQGDYQLDKYDYYMGLSFWLGIFQKYHIDIILNTRMMHGCTYDSIPNALAVDKGIFTGFFNEIGYNNSYFITDDSKDRICPFNNHDPIESINYILNPLVDKKHFLQPAMHKNCFEKILYSVGGNLLEDFGRRLITWNWTPRAIKGGYHKAGFCDKFIGYIRLKLIEKHLDSISCLPNEDEKYIFYPLHFEPEATIQVRTVLESQLVIIKMISEALPTGWKIYVKEHPNQFHVNNDAAYFFMIEGARLKNIRFYEKIKAIQSVQLIKKDISSELLVRHSQAVASIVGTVLLESVLAKKPILLFSDMHPLRYAKDAFKIHSFTDCQQALQKIADGFQPIYDDVEDVMKKYVFKGEYMADNIMELIRRVEER